MKRKIRLTESGLYNIIKKCVNETLGEMNMVGNIDGLDASNKYNMNSKRYKQQYDSFTTPRKDYDSYAQEFLNRPNAAQDFKNFPRFSKVRNLNFDPLENGQLHKDNVRKLLNDRENGTIDDYVKRNKLRMLKDYYSEVSQEDRNYYTFDDYVSDIIHNKFQE